MIIERPKEAKSIRDAKKWVLVYGRRKTGKTFIIKNFIDYDEYFFVKKDRTVISNDREITYDAFLEVLKRSVKESKTIIIDEFHRLGDGFFDLLYSVEKHGKIILISSTLFLSKKLFSSRSALLGFFAEMPIGLIDLNDCLRALSKFGLDNKELVELAILLREPICIDYFDEKEKARETLKKILLGSVKTIPALIGEIFIEEERSLSAIYEGILRAIANGQVVSSEISSYLFSRKLIKKDDPSLIQQYLSNLIEFGIIKRITVYGKNVFTYKHVSPLARIFYYADGKYNLSERKPGEKEIEMIIDEIVPKVLEDNIRELFAQGLGLQETVIEAKDYEVDACFLKFKKPEIAMEIKWKKKITREDIAKAENSLQKTKAKKRLMFVPDKKGLTSETIEFIDVQDLLTQKFWV